jgi:acetyltransferase
LRAAIAARTGTLPPDLTRRILAAYDIQFVRAATVPDEAAAVRAAETIGYPLVLKIVSPDIAHRSDAGGVTLGIAGPAGLEAAMAAMRATIRAARPDARIDGFELQQHLTGQIEAMAGFVAAPPFGALLTIGTGGTMVELQADRSLDLCPITPDRAIAMIGETRLGALLGGYRNLIPATGLAPLAGLAANLSRLAADLGDLIVECDINPVLIAPGTGTVCVVDALLVTSAALSRRGRRAPQGPPAAHRW